VPIERVDLVQVTTTTGNREDAERIAARLIDARLAACVAVSPVATTYRWRGAVERAEEWLCTIKTRAAFLSDVERAVRAIHPYETPELIATAIVAGSADYLAWIVSETESMPSTATSSEP
jgi:periplasmic divalent cation tolerance protein